MVLGELGQMQATRTKVIACATVIEEMLPLLPPDVDYRVLAFGLHVNLEALKRVLQEAADALTKIAEATLLGYGLYSQVVIGLQAPNTLVKKMLHSPGMTSLSLSTPARSSRTWISREQRAKHENHR
jgi:hypothetical protein